MKLTLDDIASLAFTTPGIGEKNTVSNGADNGANNCQASHWWRVMRHGNTVQLISNILNAPLVQIDPPMPEIRLAPGITGTGAANIVGHGNEGQLETGLGQSGAYDPTKFIFIYNESFWGPEFDKLQPSPVTYVSLWACHPGAGEDGAELVYAMAKRCGRAVRAGTGFLYCNRDKFWWENGTKWQVGTPTHKPTPIPAPSPHFGAFDPLIYAGRNAVRIDQVVAIEIARTDQAGKKVAPRRFESDQAVEIVTRLFQSPPIDLAEVAIPAMKTAEISIALADGTIVEMTVLNDRLAVDQASGTGYYILYPNLSVLD